MTNNQTIAKNTLFLYLRMLIILVISLYTSRIVLGELGVVDYGIYSIVGGVVLFLGFLNGAMVSGTQRFLSFEIGRNDVHKLKEIFNAALVVHLFLALIIFLLAETLGLWFIKFYLNIPPDRIDSALFVYHFSVLSFVISIVQVPFNSIIIARERMSVYAYFSIFEMLLKLAVVFLLIWIPFDKLKLYSILIFLISILIAATYIIYGKYNFKETHFKFIKNNNTYNSLISYSGWNLLGSFSMVAKGQGVNILSNIFFGTVVNAAYAISYQVHSAVYSFVSSFQMASNPQIIANYSAGNKGDMFNLVIRTSKFSFYLIFILTLPLIFEIEFFLSAWLKVVPEHTVIFTILILINSWIDSLSLPLVTAVQATGRVKLYQIAIGTIFTLNVPIVYVLFKTGFAPESLFFAGIVINFIALGLRLFYVKKLINEFSIGQFTTDVLLKNVPVVFLSVLFPWIIMINMQTGISRLVIVSLVSIISSIITIYFIGLKNNEKQFVKNALIGIMSKIKGIRN